MIPTTNLNNNPFQNAQGMDLDDPRCRLMLSRQDLILACRQFVEEMDNLSPSKFFSTLGTIFNAATKLLSNLGLAFQQEPKQLMSIFAPANRWVGGVCTALSYKLSAPDNIDPSIIQRALDTSDKIASTIASIYLTNDFFTRRSFDKVQTLMREVTVLVRASRSLSDALGSSEQNAQNSN